MLSATPSDLRSQMICVWSHPPRLSWYGWLCLASWILVTFPIVYVDEVTTSVCTEDVRCYQGQNSKDNRNSSNNSDNVQVLGFRFLFLTAGWACVVGSDAVILPTLWTTLQTREPISEFRRKECRNLGLALKSLGSGTLLWHQLWGAG